MNLFLSILVPMLLQAGSISDSLNELFTKAYPADRPGASVLVAHKGTILLHAGYGKADLEAGIPMSAGSQHMIGSITKQFTAVAVLDLVNQGKIDLDKTVEDYFPGLYPYGGTISIRHLLTHTSGIPSYTNQPSFLENMGKPGWTPLSVARITADLPSDFKPGDEWRYNNTAYMLLGGVIEATTGLDYKTYMDTVFLPRAGLRRTVVGDAASDKAMGTKGYSPTREGFALARHIDMSFPGGGGNILSTVGDLYAWTLAVNEGRVIPKADVEKAWTSAMLNNGTRTGYGYGWAVNDWQGRRIVEHGGGIPGFVTHAMWLPEEELFVAVLGNRDGGNPSTEALAREAMGLVLGIPVGPIEIAFAPSEFDPFVGEYELAPTFILKVWRDGNEFWTQATGQGPVRVYPESETRFFLKVVPAALEFARNEQGEVTHLTLFQAGREMPARKIK